MEISCNLMKSQCKCDSLQCNAETEIFQNFSSTVETRGGVTDAGQTSNDDEQLKIGLLSQWKLKAESHNLLA